MFDTIIIGAGIAGLAAGKYLHKNSNKNFLILESGSKIGGRVQTIEFDNKPFAIGPGWVHGRKGNPIFDILTDLNVELKFCDLHQISNFFVWDTTERKDVSELYTLRRDKIKDQIDDLIGNISDDSLENSTSFSDMLSQESDFYKNLSDLDRTVVYTTLEIFLGAPITDISGLAQIMYDEIYDSDEDTVNYRIIDPFGVTKLTDFLCQDFKNQVKLNCHVNAIEWDNDLNKVLITCGDGQEFICKNVIITVQSALLAKGSIAFKPTLPIEKISSWQYVPAVNYCRLFAKFPQRFWPNREWLVSVIENVNPFNELLLWQNCAMQNLCSEDDNILICHYTSGYKLENSRFNVEKEQLIELVTESMMNLFPQSYCKPSDVLFVSFWNSGRFSGSYSVIAPGINKSLIEQLSESVGPLHFAGESANVQLMGTMQGAYLSGIKAATSAMD